MGRPLSSWAIPARHGTLTTRQVDPGARDGSHHRSRSGRLGSAAADPVPEHPLHAAVGGRHGRDRARLGRAGGGSGRCVLRRGVRPRRRAPPRRRGDVGGLVRHGRHARVAGSAHRVGPPVEPRLRPAVPAPADDGQVVHDPRPPQRRPGDPGRRSGPPRERVHAPRRRPHVPRAGRRGGDPGDPGGVRRGVPDRRWAGRRGRRRHGASARPGGWPTDLGGRVVDRRHPTGRDAAGRRLVAPGPTQDGDLRSDRTDPQDA